MLPRGIFKGLSRILAPLWFWMAAGWAAYPWAMGSIYDDIGESLDLAEVRAFSYVMVAVSCLLGIILLVYGHTGMDADGQ